MTNLVAAMAALAAVTAPELPAWMEGCWGQRTGGRWTEECWSSPRCGMMIGYSRSGEGETLAEFELIRIAIESSTPGKPGELRYIASPGGGNSTVFRSIAKPWPGVIFYNIPNDYPQRIRYWREGEELVAEIAAADGSKPRRWRYRRLR